MDLPTIVGIIAGVATALAILGAAVRFIVHPIRKILRQSEDFREDWYGQPARPGRHAEPGVMERLTQIETEFSPDHGSSFRDSIDRIEKSLVKHVSDGHGG